MFLLLRGPIRVATARQTVVRLTCGLRSVERSYVFRFRLPLGTTRQFLGGTSNDS